MLYGYHAVREALRAQRRKCLDLFATRAAAEKLGPELAAAGLVAHIIAAEDLSRRLGGDAVHQGVLLEARPLPPASLEEIAVKSGLVLVLDQITDPHNVGAILRTAAAFAVDALVTTERHAPELSGVLAKTASGGLEHVTIVEVVNLARALDDLKDLGYLCIGLDSEASVRSTRRPWRARSLSCSAPKAKACAGSAKKDAICLPASTCRGRSRASMSRTPVPSLSHF